MDMMQGLISANAPIGAQDVMGGFLTGQKNSVDVAKTQQETYMAKYKQDLTEKLQKSIHESVDPTSGNIDPDKFKLIAHRNGVDQQAIDYALDNVLKVWTTAQGVAKAKNAVGAVSTTGATQVQDANKPTGTNWAGANANRGSMAVPTAPKKDDTGFITPDMEAGPSYKMTGSSVEGQGQTANDYSMTPDPNSLITGDAPQAPKVPGVVEAISNIEPDTGSSTPVTQAPANPFTISTLDKDTQDKLLASMRQEGKIGQWAKDQKRGDYLATAQTALDTIYNRALATAGSVPTKQMFIDKDGNVDVGAYNRATSEYNAKVATKVDEYSKDIGGKYKEILGQDLQLAGNRRAETQLATEQAKIASAGTAVEESTANINEQLKPYGFKPISPLLIQNADAGQKATLKDGAKAYATVVDLSRKLKVENRNPTVAEVNGATNQIMALDGMGSNLSNEERVSALANTGLLEKMQAKLLGDAPTGEAITSAVAQTIASRLSKGESLEEIAHNTSYPKLHAQFTGESKAFSGPGWSKQKAKTGKSSEIVRKPGESRAAYIARGGK